MSAIEHAITVYSALARLDQVRMVEIGPQSNYQTEMLRMDAYREARKRGCTVTTSTERDPRNPWLSVLRVRLVEAQP